MITLEFEGTVFEWRGPSPFYFVATPPEVSEEVEMVKRELSYGWGVVPVKITVGRTQTTTALIPKDGGFSVPIKDLIRKANGLKSGDTVKVLLSLGS